MILFVCDNDWANHQHECANALRSIGVECTDVKAVHHSFNYPTESQVKQRTDIEFLARRADVIVVFHSCVNSFIRVRGLSRLNAKVFVFHTGNFYRTKKVLLDNNNNIIAMCLADSFCIGTDL